MGKNIILTLLLLLAGCALQPVQQEKDLLLNEADRVMDEGKYDSALVLFEQYIGQFPNSSNISEAYRKSGECCIELAERSTETSVQQELLERGLGYLNQVYRNGDDYVKSLVSKGELFVLLEEYDSASHYFVNVYSTYPEHSRAAKALLKYGSLLSFLNEEDSAISIYNKLIEEYPFTNEVSDAHYEIGAIHLYRGIDTLWERINSTSDIVIAVEQYELVSEESDSWDNAMFDRGYIHYVQYMYDSTIYYHNEIYEKAPESSRADNAALYIGHVYRKRNLLDTAQIWYERVIEEYPFSGAYDNALYWAGDYYYDKRGEGQEYIDSAIDLLTRYVEIADPQNEKTQKAVNKLAKLGVTL